MGITVSRVFFFYRLFEKWWHVFYLLLWLESVRNNSDDIHRILPVVQNTDKTLIILSLDD